MSFGFGGATYTNSASGDMVAMYKIGNVVRPRSNGLYIRCCSLGHGDLVFHDFGNPTRKTGYLRMDVVNRTN